MDEIYYKCDLITGEAITPYDGGIFAQLSRSNTTIYTGQFGMNQFRRAITELQGKDPYRDYVDYKMFPHLNRMKNAINLGATIDDGKYPSYYTWLEKISTPHPLEEMLYQHGREFDRKILKRVNQFIEDERQLMYSY